MTHSVKEKQLKTGFIGGGRITRIILAGWKKAEAMPDNVIVSDINPDSLAALKQSFPEIEITDNPLPAAGADVVILALHPPLIGKVLGEIKDAVTEDSAIVSLAPKWKISAISKALDKKNPVVRIIPNAPSVDCSGYNPASFSPDIPVEKKERIIRLFSPLGKMIETEEEKLEAYAILTAMGPTYFWFQWYELIKLSESFGLSHKEALSGIEGMIKGALETMADSGLTEDEVLDLVPVRPVSDGEEEIKKLYHEKLGALYKNLTN